MTTATKKKEIEKEKQRLSDLSKSRAEALWNRDKLSSTERSILNSAGTKKVVLSK